MSRGKLEFRHLEILNAVMRTGSVTGAAAFLNISQPAASKLLALTERISGLSLFTRIGGRLQPTENAYRLYEETERIFVGMREVTNLCDRLRREEPQRMVLAALPVLTLALLPETLRHWRQAGRTPEKLTIHSRPGPSILGYVASRQVDLGLGLGTVAVPGVCAEHLVRTQFCCAIPQAHPLARAEVVHARDLHGEPYIALSRDELFQSKIDVALREAGSAPREVFECPLVSGALALASSGHGITMADAFSIASGDFPGVVLRPFQPSVTLDYYAIWPDDTNDTSGRTALVRCLREESRRMAERFHARLAGGDTANPTRDRQCAKNATSAVAP